VRANVDPFIRGEKLSGLWLAVTELYETIRKDF
jgi:hypothetical protein